MTIDTTTWFWHMHIIFGHSQASVHITCRIPPFLQRILSRREAVTDTVYEYWRREAMLRGHIDAYFITPAGLRSYFRNLFARLA